MMYSFSVVPEFRDLVTPGDLITDPIYIVINAMRRGLQDTHYEW